MTLRAKGLTILMTNPSSWDDVFGVFEPSGSGLAPHAAAGIGAPRKLHVALEVKQSVASCPMWRDRRDFIPALCRAES